MLQFYKQSTRMGITMTSANRWHVCFKPAEITIDFSSKRKAMSFVRGFEAAQKCSISEMQVTDMYNDFYQRGMNFWFKLMRFCDAHKIRTKQAIYELED